VLVGRINLFRWSKIKKTFYREMIDGKISLYLRYYACSPPCNAFGNRVILLKDDKLFEIDMQSIDLVSDLLKDNPVMLEKWEAQREIKRVNLRDIENIVRKYNAAAQGETIGNVATVR
jgi:hypothetical protein